MTNRDTSHAQDSGSKRLLRASFWEEHESAILLTIVMVGLGLRLYGITLPFVDSHNIRQTQVAIVARNLYADNMNILCTQIDVFGKSSACTIYEFPIVQSLAALLYYVFGVHDIIGRLLSVALSVGALFFMHRLARLFLPAAPALGATTLYALSPMNIYFSRAFMPESSMMFFSVASLYFLLKWLSQPRSLLYFAAILFAALTFLAKTTAVLLIVPLCCAWFVRFRWSGLQRVDFWAYVILTLGPIAVWTVYGYQVNAQNLAMPDNWKYGAIIGGRGGLGVWFDPTFYMAMARSIIGVLLTPGGFLLSAAGCFVVTPSPFRPVVYAWLGAIVLYFYALAGANAGHVYYQLPLLPVAALLAGFALQYAFSEEERPAWLRGVLRNRFLLAAALVILIGHGVLYVKFFSYMYDPQLRMPFLLEVGRVIRLRTSPDSVLAVNQPNAMVTPIAYYSYRKVLWFTVATGVEAIKDLETFRAQGGTTYVTLDTRYGSGMAVSQQNELFWRYLHERYTPIVVTEHYAIFDLTNPKSHSERRSMGTSRTV